MPIKFSVRGRDLAGAVEDAQQRIARNVKLPTGYRIEWSGEFEWLQQAKMRLAIILPITFVFIMVLLYGMFNSLRDSFMALFGLPFAIGGGMLGLYVSGLDFSISAAIGFISLFGVSVMSGILIINGYYRFAAEHADPVEAMFHAVEEQMRPILMMTLSACIGLLPAAISTGIGSQVQRPLATVIVGGMLAGPILLLVVVPALQTYFLTRGRAAEAPPDGDRKSGALGLRGGPSRLVNKPLRRADKCPIYSFRATNNQGVFDTSEPRANCAVAAEF